MAARGGPADLASGEVSRGPLNGSDLHRRKGAADAQARAAEELTVLPEDSAIQEMLSDDAVMHD
jgi:hypothetical protein